MKYSEIRDNIKTGDVIAFEGKAWFSTVIKMFSMNNISHVGLAVWTQFQHEKEPRLCVLEAHMHLGVRLIPLSHLVKEYKKEDGKIYWCPNKDPNIDRNKVIDYAFNQWGKAYTTVYQFVILGSSVIRFFRRLLGKNLDVCNDKFHCSELVTRSYIEGGLQQYDMDPAMIKPSDVLNFYCFDSRVTLTGDL